MALRIVGDTNFWVSVAGWQGSARRLYRTLLMQEHQFLTSTEILAEVGRILRILPDLLTRTRMSGTANLANPAKSYVRNEW